MGLHHLVSAAIIPLIIYWVAAWIIYILIYAGLEALSRRKKAPNEMYRKDYFMAGFAAAGSLLIPAAILLFTNYGLHPLIPGVIAVVSIGTGLRQSKERTIEKSHLIGDIAGYAIALAAIALYHH